MNKLLDIHVLEMIPFHLDLAALQKRLRIKPDSKKANELEQMVAQALPLAHPRGLVAEAYITERGEDWVEVDGQRFTSRVLRVNLETAYRVFPYLATCGPELQDWAKGFDDMLLRYWAEEIKGAALVNGLQAVSRYMDEHYHLGKTAAMSPGSLEDWPIQEQRQLFDLLGDAVTQIGVYLTDSMLMIPTKTVSGIRFPTEVDFESCQLCPRLDCPGRRAPYDPELFENRFGLHNN